MTLLVRRMISLGTLAFAVSFFLPPHFYNSPLSRFLWALDAVSPIDNWIESLAFIGAGVAIVYPYLWALVTALFFSASGNKSSRLALRSVFLCHLMGGFVITALGILLLSLRDTFLPGAAQWAAAIAPAALMVVLLAAVLIVRPARRFPAVTALTLIIFIPLQAILAYQVMLDGGAWWGFILGAGGGLIGLGGSVVLFTRS